jgi:GT2 family glycosyltransferase
MEQPVASPAVTDPSEPSDPGEPTEPTEPTGLHEVTLASPPTPDDICVVVPVWRGGWQLDQCLAWLRAAEPPPGEVVVVADGAEPDDIRRARRAGVRVVSQRPRSGPGAARNLAARQTTAPYLLFVDADVVLHRDAVGVAARELATADAVIGSYDDRPAAGNFLSQYKNLLNHHVHHRAGSEGFTFWGACGAIRREVLLSVEGFDAERYPEPSIEDIELGYRLRAAGYRLRVQPEMRATHLKRWTVRNLLRTDVRNRALPWSELILEHGGFDDDLNIDRRNRAKVALTGVLAVALTASRRPAGRVVAGAAAGGLLALDRDLLRFYHRQRGPVFAAGTVPWTWLSYGYSGGAFALALGRRLARRADRERPL